MNIEARKWASLQNEWGQTERASLPDVDAMVAADRRQRRRTWLMITAELSIAAAALAAIGAQWQQLASSSLGAFCWALLAIVTVAVLAIATWTRARSLAEPTGANLHAWLQLRRQRAVLGLRLALLAKWTVITLLPCPLIALFTATDDMTSWRTIVAVAVPSLVLAGGWLWSRREAVRHLAEVSETEALAKDWLGLSLTVDGTGRGL